MIELTEQQRQAVKNGDAIRIAAPEIQNDVVLLSAAQYELMRQSFEHPGGEHEVSSESKNEVVGNEADSSSPRLIESFLRGVGSVLEFFPSPERFERWRISHDISIDEWPAAVRGLFTGSEQNSAKRG